MPAAVKTGEYLHHLAADSKKQAVGEVPKPGSADIPADSRVKEWIVCETLGREPKLRHETLSDTWRLAVIPVSRVGEVRLSLHRQEDPHQR